MADRDVTIRSTRVIFLDGTVSAALLREEMVVGDKPKVKFVMLLSPYMQRYAKVDKSELKAEPDAPMIGEGYVTREYDASLRQVLSNNPEYPIYLMACNFAGDPVNITSPNLQLVVDLVNTIKARDYTISGLKRTITELERELEDMMATSKRSMDRRKQSSGMDDMKEILSNMILDRQKPQQPRQ